LLVIRGLLLITDWAIVLAIDSERKSIAALDSFLHIILRKECQLIGKVIVKKTGNFAKIGERKNPVSVRIFEV